VLRTYTIITIAANATMAELHDRMPVILEAEAWPTWLGEDGGDIPALMRLAGDQVLRLWPVSRAVNSVRRRRLSRAGSVAAYKKRPGGQPPCRRAGVPHWPDRPGAGRTRPSDELLGICCQDRSGHVSSCFVH
jgi:hypothetical protein